MYTHVFSPFHSNTLLTDARRLAASEFSMSGGLLGLFYARDTGDSTTVEVFWSGSRRLISPRTVQYELPATVNSRL
jgi:hypothetical protein